MTEEVRERPILFRPELVREILAGRKSVTRRPVKPQPEGKPVPLTSWSRNLAWACHDALPDEWSICEHAERLKGRVFPFRSEGRGLHSPTCPYGEPGDRLWVRETFALSIRDPDSAFAPDAKNPADWDGAVYRADGEEQGGGWDRYEGGKCVARGVTPKWRPAIHMPRWASRLVLEVTGVRVERLKEITEEQARAEGLSLADAVKLRVPSARDVFSCKWGEMYGDGPFAWPRNPWVWVVEFRHLDASVPAASRDPNAGRATGNPADRDGAAGSGPSEVNPSSR